MPPVPPGLALPDGSSVPAGGLASLAEGGDRAAPAAGPATGTAAATTPVFQYPSAAAGLPQSGDAAGQDRPTGPAPAPGPLPTPVPHAGVGHPADPIGANAVAAASAQPDLLTCRTRSPHAADPASGLPIAPDTRPG